MLKDEIKAKGDCLKILYITFIFILVVIIEFKFSYKKIKINDKISNSNIIDYNNNIDNNNIDMNLFNKKIEENYKKQGFVNLNEIESKILNGRAWMQNSDKNNVINFGFQLDHFYVSRAMITLASIMSSQNNSTLIKFHFAIVLNFTISDMLKIYTLRKRLREDVEFIFYNATRVETELDGLNKKGPGAVAKLLLPQLLPDDIDRLLIFDTGDLLVIKDLSPAYNWDMKGCLYAGVPGFGIGRFAKITQKIYDIYISVGSFLVDVKKVKEANMYQKFKANKNAYSSTIGDQDLLNDIAFGKITYFPYKFGMLSPFSNDHEAEIAKNESTYSFYIPKLQRYVGRFNFIPKNNMDFLKMGYGPSVIHHMYSKWMYNGDLTVYRRLAQYYIKLAGIWDEICKNFPGYCI